MKGLSIVKNICYNMVEKKGGNSYVKEKQRLSYEY